MKCRVQVHDFWGILCAVKFHKWSTALGLLLLFMSSEKEEVLSLFILLMNKANGITYAMVNHSVTWRAQKYIFFLKINIYNYLSYCFTARLAKCSNYLKWQIKDDRNDLRVSSCVGFLWNLSLDKPQIRTCERGVRCRTVYEVTVVWWCCVTVP